MIRDAAIAVLALIGLSGIGAAIAGLTAYARAGASEYEEQEERP
jgi:hypothetical protein